MARRGRRIAGWLEFRRRAEVRERRSTEHNNGERDLWRFVVQSSEAARSSEGSQCLRQAGGLVLQSASAKLFQYGWLERPWCEPVWHCTSRRWDGPRFPDVQRRHEPVQNLQFDRTGEDSLRVT